MCLKTTGFHTRNVCGRLPRRREHAHGRLQVDVGRLLQRVLHELGGDERGLAVLVACHHVARDQQQPVDVLVQVAEDLIDAALALADQSGEGGEIGIGKLLGKYEAILAHEIGRIETKYDQPNKSNLIINLFYAFEGPWGNY